MSAPYMHWQRCCFMTLVRTVVLVCISGLIPSCNGLLMHPMLAVLAAVIIRGHRCDTHDCCMHGVSKHSHNRIYSGSHGKIMRVFISAMLRSAATMSVMTGRRHEAGVEGLQGQQPQRLRHQPPHRLLHGAPLHHIIYAGAHHKNCALAWWQADMLLLDCRQCRQISQCASV